ncbi:uncharacterized protein LOC107427119 [Ziziphus jujuba]|uniref:Uncharacterized protein LOC107427119 n=1 Tax=Ziziphus jujuba TaxID=326968 RepID=A0ABM4AI00_ZIZJJ|nr:uncharacterized protein LOC107427119 [Ziziphus jujuba]XP_060676361.1 uncharacterized protein LOC107427119 [Ziziphus jujuba]
MASQAAASFNGNLKKALAGLRCTNLEGLRWRVFDAKGQERDKILGRLASQISTVTQGKDKPTHTPTCDDGDVCIVLNAKDLSVSQGENLLIRFIIAKLGKKLKGPDGQRPYRSHSESCTTHAAQEQNV